MGLVALQHVGSSWTRARTRVPCIGRWILNDCATRETQKRQSEPVLQRINFDCEGVFVDTWFGAKCGNI